MIKQHHVTGTVMILSAVLALGIIGYFVYIFVIKKNPNNKKKNTSSLLSKLPSQPIVDPPKNTLLNVMKTGTSEMPDYFAPPTQGSPNQWNPSENNGNSQAVVSKLCSDMYSNTPELFHNRYTSMGECEYDHRMIPLASQPNNLEFICNKYGDKFEDCKKNPLWAITGVEYNKC